MVARLENLPTSSINSSWDGSVLHDHDFVQQATQPNARDLRVGDASPLARSGMVKLGCETSPDRLRNFRQPLPHILSSLCSSLQVVIDSCRPVRGPVAALVFVKCTFGGRIRRPLLCTRDSVDISFGNVLPLSSRSGQPPTEIGLTLDHSSHLGLRSAGAASSPSYSVVCILRRILQQECFCAFRVHRPSQDGSSGYDVTYQISYRLGPFYCQ